MSAHVSPYRLIVFFLVCAVSVSVSGRGQEPPPDPGNSHLPLAGTNPEFTFTRIRYDSPPDRWGWGGPTWSHDYPRADAHLSRIVEDISTLAANIEATNVFTLDDPSILGYPVIYISEPGFWHMSNAEVRGLRNYALKGEFLIFDDFEADRWRNFSAQLGRALPDQRLIEIDVSHPIFHTFFDLKTLDFPHPLVDVTPSYHALFENNDPNDRMMAIINYNNDVAEYWEWSDRGYFSVNFTNDAYKLGVNYIIYAMSH